MWRVGVKLKWAGWNYSHILPFFSPECRAKASSRTAATPKTPKTPSGFSSSKTPPKGLSRTKSPGTGGTWWENHCSEAVVPKLIKSTDEFLKKFFSSVLVMDWDWCDNRWRFMQGNTSRTPGGPWWWTALLLLSPVIMTNQMASFSCL